MTLASAREIENPEKDTAGLASTTQLINNTGLAPTMTFNTSSASLDHILFLSFSGRRKPSRRRKEKHEGKHGTFRTNLRKAMRINAEILKDLAGY